jgi:drug/metabolite transporter (DMT)-like permease
MAMTASEQAAARSPAQGRILAGYMLAGGGAALFSTKAIFIKLAYMELTDAPLLLALRMVFALPVFALIGVYAFSRMKAQGKPTPSPSLFASAALTGFIGYYLASLLDFEGLVYITAQLERLVLFTYPIFVMLLGWAFFGAKLTRIGLIAAFVTYLGLVVVFNGGITTDAWSTTIGTLLVLGAALSFALYQLLARKIIGLMGSTLFTSVAMSAASLGSILHWYLFSNTGLSHLSPRYLSLAAGTAIFATIVPSFMINAGLGRIGAQSTAMISTISPLVTIYLAVIFLGEQFTLIDALGTVLIIGGIGLYSWFDVRKPKS